MADSPDPLVLLRVADVETPTRLPLLAGLWKSGAMADVELVCGGRRRERPGCMDGGRRRVQAHRAVLAAASAALGRLVAGEHSHGESDPVELAYAPDVVRAVLEFVYTGTAEIGAERLLACYEAAQELELPGLAAAVERRLALHVTPDACLGVLAAGRRHGSRTLVAAGADCLAEHLVPTIAATAAFGAWDDQGSLDAALSSPHLRADDEEALCGVLLGWGAARPFERLPAVVRLLAHVRFGLIRAAYLRQLLIHHPLAQASNDLRRFLQGHLSHHEGLINGVPPPSRCWAQPRSPGAAVAHDLLLVDAAHGARRLEREDAPASACWRAAGAPADQRSCMAAAATADGTVVVLGGDNPAGCLNTCERFDPTADAWSGLPPMSTPRSAAAAAAHGQMVFAVGGFDGVNDTDIVECLHVRPQQPTSGPFACSGSGGLPALPQLPAAPPSPPLPGVGDWSSASSTASSIAPSCSSASSSVASSPPASPDRAGLVQFHRACPPLPAPFPGSLTGEPEALDAAPAAPSAPASLSSSRPLRQPLGQQPASSQPASQPASAPPPPAGSSWSTLPPLRRRRHGLGCAVLDNSLFAIGGISSASGRSLDDVEVLRLPEEATAHARQLLLVAGGSSEEQAAAAGWRPCAPLPTPRGGLVVVVLGGFVYAVGGQGPDADGCGPTPLRTVERYDPTARRWEPVASMCEARSYAAGAVVGGRIVVTGGIDGTASPVASAESYDPATDTWRRLPAAAVPGGVSEHALAAVPGGGGGRQWC